MLIFRAVKRAFNKRHNFPDLIIEIINQIPRKNATIPVISPKSEIPLIKGFTSAACIIAELRIIALTIRLKDILLLDF